MPKCFRLCDGVPGQFFQGQRRARPDPYFPGVENAIRDYAYVNRDTQLSNPPQFMKIMADYVNNLIQKTL